MIIMCTCTHTSLWLDSEIIHTHAHINMHRLLIYIPTCTNTHTKACTHMHTYMHTIAYAHLAVKGG